MAGREFLENSALPCHGIHSLESFPKSARYVITARTLAAYTGAEGSVMRCRVVLAVVCAAWAGGFHAGLSQTPAAPAPEVSTLSARSTLVLVPTLVRTKNGQLVHTLN